MSRYGHRGTAHGLIPVLVIAFLSLYRPAFFTSLEYATYDALARAMPARPPGGQVVIVDVDERSLSAIGQWPWRRDRIGELVTRLRDLGASVVALDIMFPEPDRGDGTSVDPDAALADVLRKGQVVLGYGLTFEKAPKGPGCMQHPLRLAVVRRANASEDDPYFGATGAVCNLPVLTDAAGASGFLNAAPDPDGILRRAPLLAGSGGRVYPALGLAATRALTGTRDVTLTVENANASSLMLDGRRVPIDGKGNLLLRYRGAKQTFPYVSAVDVLNGRVPPGTFERKLVLVGTTALGTREVVSTPLDTLFTGVEVQATIADNLLQQDFLHRPGDGTTLEMVLVLVFGAIAVLLVKRFGAVTASVASTACLVVLWKTSLLTMSTDGTVLSPLWPTLATAGVLATMTITGLRAERRRADRAGVAKATSERLMIQTLLSLTEMRDAETGRHSRRTQQYTRILAGQLAAHPAFRDYLTPERVDLLATLAPLHDIGKVGVPDQLLHKPGALTPEELAEIRKHPTYGRDVILNAQRDAGVRHDATLALAKDIAYTHHERWDGTGYPERLSGAQIPIPGRVIAVVDVYDALRSHRPYSQPKTHDEAAAVICKGRGTHFDPAVVDAFVSASEELRRISDGECQASYAAGVDIVQAGP